jgi:hypothetical protein
MQAAKKGAGTLKKKATIGVAMGKLEKALDAPRGARDELKSIKVAFPNATPPNESAMAWCRFRKERSASTSL